MPLPVRREPNPFAESADPIRSTGALVEMWGLIPFPAKSGTAQPSD